MQWFPMVKAKVGGLVHINCRNSVEALSEKNIRISIQLQREWSELTRSGGQKSQFTSDLVIITEAAVAANLAGV